MDAKFSARVREVISLSREEALRLGHNYIGVEHLLLGIIKEGEGTAVRIVEGLNCDLQNLRKLVEGSVRPSGAKAGGAGNIPLVKQAEKILKITYLEAKIFKSPVIGTEHLLLSILKDEDNVATKSIQAFNIDYDVAKEEFESLLSEGGAPSASRAEHPLAESGDPTDDGPGNYSAGGDSEGNGGRKGDPKSSRRKSTFSGHCRRSKRK